MNDYNSSVDLASMSDRIRRLPISPKGWPVPWFVQWFDDGQACEAGSGTPDFRVIGTDKLIRAVKERRCWVCGGLRGSYLAFVIGPMCALNRTISEPPSHRECAIWSAENCPFLAHPAAKRNERDIRDDDLRLRGDLKEAPGIHLARNPGAVCVWVTKSYQPFKAPGGGVLFSIGEPVETLWFAEGRPATRAEVVASIDSGLPALQKVARQEGGGALEALERDHRRALTLVPA